MRMLALYSLSTAICRAAETPSEFNADPANAAPVVVPTVKDIKASLTSAAAAATSAAEAASGAEGATLVGSVKAGWTAFSEAIENDAISLGEEAASAFGGPIAGAAADVVLPDVVPMMAQALGTLFNHIGAELPPDLKAFLDKL